MNKKLATVFLLFATTCFTSGFVKPPGTYTIDAEKNAITHNNKGINAVEDKNYYEAIQEFSLAILLNPKTQATSVYYNNLGETYMKLGYYREAQGCFEKALQQYNLDFLYYQNLVKSIKAQHCIPAKIKYYQSKSDKNPLSMIIVGLLYVNSGDVKRGIIKLDEFCMSEPDLLITDAVRNYIKSILPKN